MDAPAVAVSATGKELAIAWMDESGRKGDRDVSWNLNGKKIGPLSGDTKGNQGHTALAHDGDRFWAAWESTAFGKPVIVARSESSKEAVRLGAGSMVSLAARDGLVVAVWETGQESVQLKVLSE
jgi:hypothetical protein